MADLRHDLGIKAFSRLARRPKTDLKRVQKARFESSKIKKGAPEHSPHWSKRVFQHRLCFNLNVNAPG